MTIYEGDNRKSIALRWLKNEIRKEAIKQGDEELKAKLWRWYYKVKDAEYEVAILVRESDVRTLLKLAIAKRWLDAALLHKPIALDDDEDEDAGVPPRPQEAESKPKSRKKQQSNHDDLPRQLTLWDE